MKRNAQKLECQKISRSDPVKYQRKLALQRGRRKREVTESLTNAVIKGLCLDSESKPSTSSCNPILCEDSNPITEKLWDKAQSDFSRIFQMVPFTDAFVVTDCCLENPWYVIQSVHFKIKMLIPRSLNAFSLPWQMKVSFALRA
ncbi:hypothetical protein AVEN_237182-1 [Araneus ventricosus]|uniref:Uncharacterized protein n=1 Tax=Araneus ventricosus TaxID=182803 RepID=A0A4Y2T7Q2_ARAVE|nr:hypothetical protein AVEN_237182-1 [Araneus ventricosus]